MAGCLYLVATPIGNLEDMTLRAIRVLKEVQLVAAEDTRRARQLLSHFGISTPTLSLFAANETARLPQLLRRLESGEDIAVISDAGTPTLSDPGFELHRACLAAGIEVDVIPGASASITALLLSGLPPTRFRFLGFLPRKGGARRQLLARVADDPDPSILFESPRRLAKTLQELVPYIADREVVVTREMTKLHQEVLRGSAADLAERCELVPPRGEITIVVSGCPNLSIDPAEIEEEIRRRLALGENPRDIAKGLRADGIKLPKREIYNLALSLKG